MLCDFYYSKKYAWALGARIRMYYLLELKLRTLLVDIWSLRCFGDLKKDIIWGKGVCRRGRGGVRRQRSGKRCNAIVNSYQQLQKLLIDRSLLLILAFVILLFLCCNFGRLSYDMQEHEVAHWIDSSSFYTLMSCTTT